MLKPQNLHGCEGFGELESKRMEKIMQDENVRSRGIALKVALVFAIVFTVIIVAINSNDGTSDNGKVNTNVGPANSQPVDVDNTSTGLIDVVDRGVEVKFGASRKGGPTNIPTFEEVLARNSKTNAVNR